MQTQQGILLTNTYLVVIYWQSKTYWDERKLFSKIGRMRVAGLVREVRRFPQGVLHGALLYVSLIHI